MLPVITQIIHIGKVSGALQHSVDFHFSTGLHGRLQDPLHILMTWTPGLLSVILVFLDGIRVVCIHRGIIVTPELVEMGIVPSHGKLNHVMQSAERDALGDHHPPPGGGKLSERDSQLVTFHVCASLSAPS